MRASDVIRALEALIVSHGDELVFASHFDGLMTLVRPVEGIETEVVDGVQPAIVMVTS